ncbi:hypothetical protein BKA67DRAFT_565169 [Truncatella angustata]|uniref:Uncharacterized protein n=1 Tax=Truncatella angustata TaxID=152316 RepID=A0A9P8ZXS8_9PEZI|nr:uncharacterized protein BKA67DRAFT_565169 [Truncatella angustata]KAH6654438.1 hypothetical protein BKA67DRAFT_565169 [Truncatella angustata]
MRTHTVIPVLALLEIGSAYSIGINSRNELAMPQTSAIALRAKADLAVHERQDVSLNIDCNKMVDQLVGFISQYPEYSARVLGIASGTTIAYNVCRLMDGQKCVNVAGTVGGTLSFAVFYGMMVQNPKDKGAQAVNTSRRRSRPGQDAGYGAWLRSQLESHIAARNMTFGSISEVATLDARDLAEPASYSLVIRGLTDSGNDDEVADHHLTLREDGAGSIKILPPRDTDDSDLVKRTSGSGFKITWAVSNRGDGLPESNGYKFLATQAANDWARRADTQDMGDYVGKFEFGEPGTLVFRIIPELAGFGQDYEDPTKCN